MSITAFILAALLTAAVTPVRADTPGFPVRLRQEWPLERIRNLEEAESAWRSPIDRAPGWVQLTRTAHGTREVLTASNCPEYLSLRSQGYRSHTTEEAIDESYARFRCHALERIRQARPSRRSYWSTFRPGKDSLRYLPPCLGRITDDAEWDALVDKAMRTATSLRAFDPAATMRRTEKDRLSFRDATREVSVDFAVWGDFNGDGVEDVLALVAARSLTSPARAFSTVQLTRLTPDGVFRVLSEQGESRCTINASQPVSRCSWDAVDEARAKIEQHFSKKRFQEARRLADGLVECAKWLDAGRQYAVFAAAAAAAYRTGDIPACLRTLDAAPRAPAGSEGERVLSHNRRLCAAGAR